MAGLHELAQQIINLDNALAAANSRITALEAKPSGDSGGGFKNKSLIKDPNKLYPDNLLDHKNFKKWSDDFLRWVRIESEELYDVLVHAQKAKNSIPSTHVPAEWKDSLVEWARCEGLLKTLPALRAQLARDEL